MFVNVVNCKLINSTIIKNSDVPTCSQIINYIIVSDVTISVFNNTNAVHTKKQIVAIAVTYVTP